MNFLAPLFLLGATAVALPVVFHLIRRNTRQKTPFSSLLFLQPTPPRMRQRSRLEDLLLLLLRCAVFLLLALAFARPFLPRDVFADPSSDPGQRVVLLVDTSASMRRAGLWDAAIRQTGNALASLRPADQAALFTFDREAIPRVSFESWTAASPEARSGLVLDTLRALSPGWAGTHLDQALIQAADALLDRGDDKFKGPRRIVLITDLQDGSRLERLQSYDWPRDVTVTVVPLNPSRAGNAGLQWLADSTAIPGASNAFVRVRVANAADSSGDRFEIAWARPGSDAPVAPPVEVRVAPGGVQVTRLEVPSGAEPDRLILRGDDEPFDNVLHLVPPAVGSARVLYFGNESATNTAEPLFFLRRAFPETNSVGVSVEARPLDGALAEAGPGTTAGLLVVGGTPTVARAAELRALAQAGKTVLFVVRGPEAAAPLARLLDVPAVTIDETRPANYALLGEIDLRHPLFAAFADPRFSDFTKIRIWRHRKLGLDAVPQLRVPLRFDSGDPALVEQTVGSGRVVVLAMGWHPGDSQLAVSSKFVPLLYALLEGSGAGPHPVSGSVAVGEPLVLPAPAAAGANLRGPAGTVTNLVAGTTRFPGTTVPGLYTYTAAAGERPVRFAVNLDAAESRTTPMLAEDLERLGVSLRSAPTGPSASPEHTRQLAAAEAEGRQKLWRWALLATLVFILAETALAGRMTRQATPAGGATA